MIERGGSGELVERDSRRTHRVTNKSEKPIQNRTRLVLKCDESGLSRDESGARGMNRANLGTNQRRERQPPSPANVNRYRTPCGRAPIFATTAAWQRRPQTTTRHSTRLTAATAARA